jgi:hypothetical protein
VGDTATETLSEIDATRQRLGSDIDALEARIPDRDELADQAKVYGGAAAGAGVAILALISALKKRRATKERRRHARDTAEALAEIMEVIPVEATARIEHTGSRTGPMALVAAAAGLAIALLTARKQRRRPTP